MYSTCIFCHSNLGKNESVEHFPIGRRLAFDAARGRLWVVCTRCERWNLTPLEERWEAIEDCERLFSSTKLRVSTEHIGLARLRAGLELVRIGEPQRPEMAAWRYGDQFGRRRRRHLIYTGVGLAVFGAAYLSQIGGVFVAGGALAQLSNLARQSYAARKARVRLKTPDHAEPIVLRNADLRRAWIEPEDDGWALNLSYGRKNSSSIVSPVATSFRLVPAAVDEVRLTGDDASRALAQVLPALNADGGSRADVQSAVGLLEDDDTNRDAMLRRWIDPRLQTVRRKQVDPSLVLRLSSMPRATLLALEMAANEQTERLALEGELTELEEMWRQAEEVAAIADDLFVADATRDKLDALKRSRDSR